MRKNPHKTTTKDYLRARQLRQESSSYEQKLWFALRRATLGKEIKFRRQQPIHPYIVDFACMKAKLLIEIDGISHDVNPKHDRIRDAYLQKQGFKILRIPNDEVVRNLEATIEAIVAEAKKLLP